MLFNSFVFLFVFLPVTLFGYYLIPRRNWQLTFLFVASVFFYAYWSSKFVFFLLFTVVLDFYIARLIFLTSSSVKKRMYLLTSVTINLGILFIFKYYDLIARTLNNLNWYGHQVQWPILNLILPIGISFYTFQSMSYVIDVYRSTSSAHGRFLPFATYVTLFPHQISGPLVRHNTIVPELESPSTYRFSLSHFLEGLQFFILGLSKKVLLADLISLGVTPLANNISVASNTEAILAMVGYSMQLYFDFSGYSDMAIGLGLMLNIHFPQNFNSPYKSRSITEFWQRWHMTLSSWLKDYLYISLGGNKKGSLKTYRNLFLTMVIGGLWHGSNWTFAFWGLFHGTILAIEKVLKDLSPYGLRLPWGSRRIEFLKIIWTFFLVNLGWIFFRASDFNSALIWLKKVFFIINEQTYSLALIPERHKDRFFIALGISLLIVFFGRNSWAIKKDLTWKRALILGFLVALTLMYMGDESPFLYFQF